MLYTEGKTMIKYDPCYDVMRYIFGDTSNSYGDEESDNIITLRDIDTDEITGYTIMNFKKICRDMSSEYKEIKNRIDVEEAMKCC